MFRSVIAAACVLCLSCRPLPTRAQELFFNGTPYDTAVGQVLLAPGQSNHLAVGLPDRARTNGVLRVLWELTAPQGQTRCGESQVGAGVLRAHGELGPLVAPPVYEFEAGRVFQQGYRLSVRVMDGSGRPIRAWSFYQEHGSNPSELKQGMGETEPLAQRVRLVAGHAERLVYHPRFGSAGPLSLRLGASVLTDQDDLQIQARLNAGDVPERMQCVIRLATAAEAELWREEVDLRRGDDWRTCRVDTAAWPAGDYHVELLPKVNGQLWTDCPRLRYHRHPTSGTHLSVSPVAPWKLERDLSRQEVRIVDFRAEHRKSGNAESGSWRWIEGEDGAVAVASNGDFLAPPLLLRPAVQGYHAVFVTFEHAGGIIQVGRQGLIRGVSLSGLSRELFVEAACLTDDEIRIYPSRDPQSKLVSVRLVPITETSARALAFKLAHPPLSLMSVNDWAEYFGTSWSRLLPDQFTAIVGGQVEFGFRTVGWSVGRSWVEYPSKLPEAQVFPCVPYEQARQSPEYPDDPYDYRPRIVMMNQHDPLAGALAAGTRCQARIWAWLGMQRHYSESFYGGMFCSPFYRQHPEWRQVSKDGKPSGLSFYFPAVRGERVNILVEVAERGADGLLIGCDRQVPMLRYEPALVEQFRTQTGIDARTIDRSDGPPFDQWIRFRADFFTQTLRELKQRLDPLRVQREAPIPVGVRIPSGGLFLNLAQGLDVEAWCQERLVDLIDLDPLEETPGESNHDVRPYLALGRKYGIPVIGGIGSTAFRVGGTVAATPDYAVITAGLKRARGLHYAGVDGIDTYETEVLTWTDPVRFAVALYGHPDELARFLVESNLEAVYPVDAGTAAAGHDNHSVWRPGWTWSLSGFDGRSL